MARLVTVVNRTNEPLQGTWAGKPYDIPPGESTFSVIQAEAFRRQNPVMGSGDPRQTEIGMTGKMEYKLGIKEYGHPCDPISGKSQGVERWDRTKLVGARPSEVVAGDNGIYSGRDVASGSFTPNTAFTKA